MLAAEAMLRLTPDTTPQSMEVDEDCPFGPGLAAATAWAELQRYRAMPIAQAVGCKRQLPAGAASTTARKRVRHHRQPRARDVKRAEKRVAQKKGYQKQIKNLKEQLERLQNKAGKDRRALVALESETSKGLRRLLMENTESLPPQMVHLRALVKCQIRVLENPSERCMWHPAVLEAACAIYSCNASSYSELFQSGLLALPTPDHVRKQVAAAVTTSSGHDISIYKALGKEVADWPDAMKEICLMYDEVNLVGQLSFKKVGSCFCFFGLVDDPDEDSAFKDPSSSTLSLEDRIRKLKAKAALVMQAVCIHDVYNAGLSEERVFRRVVGVHAVSSPPAEKVEKLLVATIAMMELYAGVTTVATCSDGASTFRLQQKMTTSGNGRGTANTFINTTRPNDARPGRVINMLSDISHLIKKACSCLHSSDPESTARFMKLPNYLVQMVFATRPYPGVAEGTEESGTTAGLEAYIYVWAHIWELMGASDQPPYTTSDPDKDERLEEMEDLLAWLDMWHDYNLNATALQTLKAATRKMCGLTHENFYDTHACLRGFLNVLKDLDDRHDEFTVLARKFCTDCIESLFGQMRQANGGMRDLPIKRVLELSQKLQVYMGHDYVVLLSRGCLGPSMSRCDYVAL